MPPAADPEYKPVAAEPPDCRSASDLPVYVAQLCAWIPQAADEDLKAHLTRNKRYLDYVKANRPPLQQKFDEAIDGRNP